MIIDMNKVLIKQTFNLKKKNKLLSSTYLPNYFYLKQ